MSVFTTQTGKVSTRRTGLTVDGIAGVSMDVRNLIPAARRGLARGIRMWCEAVAVQSGNEVPRITGFLANSLRIVMHNNASRISAVIEYLAAYAAAVHEHPRPPTSNGKWKFLEHPYNDLLPDLPNYVGREISAELSK